MNKENNLDRVRVFGEVKTQNKEINNMIELVRNEVDRIDLKFLEPACGDGNFLYNILEKKLNVALKISSNDLIKFEINSIYALTSLYGVEIQLDNVNATRLRLFNLFQKIFNEKFKSSLNNEFSKSVKYILKKNIIHGDALTFKENNNKDNDITFAEWSMINDTDFKRRDYTFRDLLAYQPYEQKNLFSDLGDEAFIPTPIKEYKPKNYLKLYEYS